MYEKYREQHEKCLFLVANVGQRMRNAIERLYFSLRTYLAINTLHRNNENMRNDFAFSSLVERRNIVLRIKHAE